MGVLFSILWNWWIWYWLSVWLVVCGNVRFWLLLLLYFWLYGDVVSGCRLDWCCWYCWLVVGFGNDSCWNFFFFCCRNCMVWVVSWGCGICGIVVICVIVRLVICCVLIGILGWELFVFFGRVLLCCLVLWLGGWCFSYLCRFLVGFCNNLGWWNRWLLICWVWFVIYWLCIWFCVFVWVLVLVCCGLLVFSCSIGYWLIWCIWCWVW